MGKEEGYFSRLGHLFSHPKKFLDSAAGEKKYSKILFFYVFIAVIAIVFDAVLAFIRAYYNPGDMTLAANLGFIALSVLFSIGLAFVSPFVISFIIHLGVLVFGGKKGYFNTFKPITYSAAISEIYQVFLVILGVIAFFTVGDLVFNGITAVSPGLLAVTVLYFLVLVISLIHVLYAEIIGISKFQAMPKGKAFLSIVFVPVIILVLGMIIYFAVTAA